MSHRRAEHGWRTGRTLGPTMSSSLSTSSSSSELVHPARRRRRRQRRLLLAAMVASGLAAGAIARRLTRDTAASSSGAVEDQDGRLALGWGDALVRPATQTVRTPDGATLAVWDVEGSSPDAPTVVLSHGWTNSHEVWLPVTRRLHEEGYRVVLIDQRGHGESTRGTAPLSIDTLAHDFAQVLTALDVRDAVLVGHSMGGITIMSLASYRPDVLRERARATVLVSTSAQSSNDRTARGARFVGGLAGSTVLTRAMNTRNGHLLVRGAFGTDPVRSHMVLTRDLFTSCNGPVRGGFLVSLATVDLVEGIASIDMPTTVIVGSRDTLTWPKKADQIVGAVPGSRLVTVKDRGHMLPLEDPDAVTDEIVRAIKG
jgi:pimeloyl-ACP methyl ester carboxylesterase